MEQFQSLGLSSWGRLDPGHLLLFAIQTGRSSNHSTSDLVEAEDCTGLCIVLVLFGHGSLRTHVSTNDDVKGYFTLTTAVSMFLSISKLSREQQRKAPEFAPFRIWSASHCRRLWWAAASRL